MGKTIVTRNGFYTIEETNAMILDHIKRILLTSFGERVGHIQIGSDLTRYFFEQENYFVETIQANLKIVIERNEPLVNVNAVNIVSGVGGEYVVSVLVSLKDDNTLIPINVQVWG